MNVFIILVKILDDIFFLGVCVQFVRQCGRLRESTTNDVHTGSSVPE